MRTWAVGLLVVAACTGGGSSGAPLPEPKPAPTPDADAGALTLSIEGGLARFSPGAFVSLPVNINGIRRTGNLTLVAEGLPAGVSMDPWSLDDAANPGPIGIFLPPQFILRAAKDAPLGEANVTMRLTNTSKTAGEAPIVITTALRVVIANTGIDGTFGDSGFVVFDDAKSGFDSIAVNPDGSLILGGYQDAGSVKKLVRLGPDGAVDPTFTASLQLGSALALAIRPNDGKIIVAGSAPTSGHLSIEQRNADGTPDTLFGNGGLAQIPFQGAHGALMMSLDANGRVAVGGVGFAACNYSVVARFDGTGNADPDFATPAKICSETGRIEAITTAPDGSVIAAARSSGAEGQEWLISRWKNDGTPDTNFGQNGTARRNMGKYDSAPKALGSFNGTIYVAGHTSSSGTKGDVALIAFTDGGLAIDQFGTNGMAAWASPQGSGILSRPIEDQVAGLLIDPGGTLFVAGHSDPSEGTGHAFALRFSPHGDLDATYGTAGVSRPALAKREITIRSIARAPDGKVIALAGLSQPSGYAVLRFWP
jgi:uncharacterized delta-60 repeat protein